jgi:hypothetical protein
MLKFEFVGDVVLANDFWDCACEKNYINRKADNLICHACGCEEGESPDSLANEVLIYYGSLSSEERKDLFEACISGIGKIK